MPDRELVLHAFLKNPADFEVATEDNPESVANVCASLAVDGTDPRLLCMAEACCQAQLSELAETFRNDGDSALWPKEKARLDRLQADIRARRRAAVVASLRAGPFGEAARAALDAFLLRPWVPEPQLNDLRRVRLPQARWDGLALDREVLRSDRLRTLMSDTSVPVEQVVAELRPALRAEGRLPPDAGERLRAACAYVRFAAALAREGNTIRVHTIHGVAADEDLGEGFVMDVVATIAHGAGPWVPADGLNEPDLRTLPAAFEATNAWLREVGHEPFEPADTRVALTVGDFPGGVGIRAHGESLELLAAVALAAHRTEQEIDPFTSATGRLDGLAVRHVGEMRAKAEAAAWYGIRTLLVPAEDEGDARDGVARATAAGAPLPEDETGPVYRELKPCVRLHDALDWLLGRAYQEYRRALLA